jgi:hypothetical protein
MPPSPDPVAEGSGYQEFILGQLGDDDPAEVQAATPPEMRRLIEVGGESLGEPPAAGEWSALETFGHMLDAEIVAAARYRWILAEPEPSLLGYDQDLWVSRLHEGDDAQELLALFEALRSANLSLWRRTPVGERARLGMHTERGPESYELTFKLIAGHDRNHLAQARDALSLVNPQS